MKSSSERTLMRACAKFILGESSGVKITGTAARVAAFQAVLTASRNLYEALSKGQPLNKVKRLLDEKHDAAAKFKRATGIDWRL